MVPGWYLCVLLVTEDKNSAHLTAAQLWWSDIRYPVQGGKKEGGKSKDEQVFALSVRKDTALPSHWPALLCVAPSGYEAYC